MRHPRWSCRWISALGHAPPVEVLLSRSATHFTCALLFCVFLAIPSFAAEAVAATAASAANVASSGTMDSLLNLMLSKGVLSSAEVAGLRGIPANQQMTPLLSLLAKKGVLSQDEVSVLLTSVASPQSVVVSATASRSGFVQTTSSPPLAKAPDKPAVIAAVAPLRVLPVDPPKKDGMIPDLKLGPVKVKPYGMIKASVIYDTSSPRGD